MLNGNRQKIIDRLIVFQWALVMFVSLLFTESQSFASPSSLTYQGRIVGSNGVPLEYENVSFLFQITDPSGACIIYQEQVTGYSMVNSGGVFDVTIGRGTIQYPQVVSSVLDAFNNTTTFSCASCSLVDDNYVCTNGSSTYAAAAGDGRKLRVSFHDGIGWRTISPDSSIRSVPYAGYALSAQKLGTNVASDFLLKAGLPTCAAGTYLSYDGAALSCMSVGTASTSTNFSGGLYGDVNGTQGATSVDRIKGIGIDFSTAPAAGQILKFNGVSWAPGNSTSVTAAGTPGNPTIIGGTATEPTIDLSKATATTNGYLSSSDWTTFNNKQSASLADAKVWVGQSGVPVAVAPSGDVSMTNGGAFSVNALRGTSLSAAAPSEAGQILKYDGTSSYVPSFLSLADIRSSVNPANTIFPSVSCTANQTLTWSSLTDTMTCTSISVGASNFSSQSANSFLAAPNGAAGAPSFRAIASADLPKTGAGGVYVNGGNSFGGVSSIGNNDGFDLNIRTNNQSRVTVTAGGRVGIGTGAPSAALEVNGDVLFGNATNYLRYNGTADLILQSSARGTGGRALVHDGGNAEVLNYAGDFTGGVRIDGAGNTPNLFVSAAGNGNVGIGTTAPATKLDVQGGVKIGNEATCDASREGTQRYNSASKVMQFCNGTAWQNLGTATLGQNSCEWINVTTCGHSCGMGTYYQAVCPAGKYVAGWSTLTWNADAPHNFRIYCCAP